MWCRRMVGDSVCIFQIGVVDSAIKPYINRLFGCPLVLKKRLDRVFLSSNRRLWTPQIRWHVITFQTVTPIQWWLDCHSYTAWSLRIWGLVEGWNMEITFNGLLNLAFATPCPQDISWSEAALVHLLNFFSLEQGRFESVCKTWTRSRDGDQRTKLEQSALTRSGKRRNHFCHWSVHEEQLSNLI